MRGRGNDLAEELDRVNKKLAGAGPYQDAIISHARRIHSTFKAAGEGFSSSLESAVDAVQALQKQLGNIHFVTGGLVDTMTKLKLSINLSDDEVAKVLDTYLTVDNLSESAAINSAEMLYAMSEQAGLNPAEVFREIASATGETLAHFKGGGHELNKAVISAKRMGLSLEDVAKISRGLLDFESSIEAEMEAQMLTGMNINFNRARMFAMNKEGAKAAEEVLRQVGGLERFRRMNIFQQEAIAKATGLTVNELLKTNAQREREARIAKEKQQIHKDTVKMLPVVTSVMGKLDTGLGIIEKIANILGDIVLDVFGVEFKEAEELILKFVKSDTFTTGLKNILYFMKGVMDGIKSAITTVWDVLKNMPWIGDFLKNIGSQDMSGGYEGAQKGGKFVGQALAYGYMAKKVLGMTPLTAMWVQSASGALKGLGSAIFKGLGGLFGKGGGAAAGGGQLSLFPNLVPHGAGAGGGGMLAGMSGGQMLGYGAAAAFIAKGAYDVLSLDNKNTSGEAAGAVGGLLGAGGGAKAGAMIGTMIAPGIGTAIGAAVGAGVGYFGGQMVKHISWFQDDLDKARIKLVKSESDLLHKKTMQNNKLRMQQVEASNKVRQSYVDFGLTTKGITENELENFAQAQLDAGNITKDQFNAGLRGEITPLKLLELASQSAAGKLGLEQQAREKWVEDQMSTKEIENFMEIEELKQKLTTVRSLTDDMIDDKITKSYLEEHDAKMSNWVMTGVFTDEDMEKAQKMLYKLYGGAVDMKDIEKATKDLSWVSGMYATKTDAMEKALESVKDELESGLETQLTDAQFKHNQAELKYLEQSAKMKYDPQTGGLVVTVKDKPNVNTKAAGGVLQGPSHAQGGIQTKFGEMEGGEAVINKKSTAKYWDLLSRINQDQGGVAFGGKRAQGGRFANGGITGGYYEDGFPMLDPTQNVQAQVESIDASRVKAAEGTPDDAFYDYRRTLMEQGYFMPGMRHYSDGDFYSEPKKHPRNPFMKYLAGPPPYSKAKAGAHAIRFTQFATGGHQLGSRRDSNAMFRDELRMYFLSELHPGKTYGYGGLGFGIMEGRRPGLYEKGSPAGILEEKWAGEMRAKDANTLMDVGTAIVGGAALTALAPAVVNMVRQAIVRTFMTNINMAAGGAQTLFASPAGTSALTKIIGAAQMGAGVLNTKLTVDALENLMTGEFAPGDFFELVGGAEPFKSVKKAYKTSIDFSKGHYADGVARWIAPALLKNAGGRHLSFNDFNKMAVEGGLDTVWKFIDKSTRKLTDEYGLMNLLMDQFDVVNEAKKAENKSSSGWFGLPDMGITEFFGMGDGGITGNSPISKDQNQYFRSLPAKKVNDMILTSEGQMIETHPDDNIIAKKGGITQKTGTGSKGSANEMINLLRELIIVNKNAKIKVNSSALAEAVNRGNYINS